MNTYHLTFTHYTNSPYNRPVHAMYVEARSLNAAIRKIEKQNPDWFFVGCDDQWKGPINTWGLG